MNNNEKQIYKWLQLSLRAHTLEQKSDLADDISRQIDDFYRCNPMTFEEFDENKGFESSYPEMLHLMLEALCSRANQQVEELSLSEQLDHALHITEEMRRRNFSELQVKYLEQRIEQISKRVDDFLNRRGHCYKAIVCDMKNYESITTTFEQIRVAIKAYTDYNDKPLFEPLKDHVVKLEKADMKAAKASEKAAETIRKMQRG